MTDPNMAARIEACFAAELTECPDWCQQPLDEHLYQEHVSAWFERRTAAGAVFQARARDPWDDAAGSDGRVYDLVITDPDGNRVELQIGVNELPSEVFGEAGDLDWKVYNGTAMVEAYPGAEEAGKCAYCDPAVWLLHHEQLYDSSGDIVCKPCFAATFPNTCANWDCLVDFEEQPADPDELPVEVFVTDNGPVRMHASCVDGYHKDVADDLDGWNAAAANFWSQP